MPPCISISEAQRNAEASLPERKALAILFVAYLEQLQFRRQLDSSNANCQTTSSYATLECCSMHRLLNMASQELLRRCEAVAQVQSSGHIASQRWWQDHGFDFDFQATVVE
jgi:phage-related minor tail protein